MAAHLVQAMPEIGNAHVEELVLRSLQANIAVAFDQLARGVSPTEHSMSPEVLTYTREMVRRGFALDAVMRGYRLSTVYLVDCWIDCVAASGAPAQVALDVVKEGSGFLWTWAEVAVGQLTAEYEAEAKRLALERSQARLLAVHGLLDAAQPEPAAAARRLGLDVSARHLAIVISSAEGPGSSDVLDAALRALSRDLGPGRLAVHADARTLWCWSQCPDGVVLDSSGLQAPVLVGTGRPGTGVEGFRRSHREALAASRVAEQVRGARPLVVAYADVRLAAMCVAEPLELEAFVRDTLGYLAGAQADTRRQRETLAAFLSAHCNYRAAAAVLGIHHNTVRYRVEQVERRLGRDVTSHRRDLEVALHLSHVLGLHDAGSVRGAHRESDRS
ncbi:helix-turn-helix domain-containing protein [Klenkia sp. LSe6-5]|uniref:Helix-turn-helix domain-containing protein n=1 Tax=Klenkia sesuvii TaxID=3103137 RepID=A0ABU8DT39_9ACTN